MKKQLPYSREHLLYIRKIKRETIFVWSLRFIILIGFIGLWELLARLNVIDAFITSCPSKIFITIGNLITRY